MSLTIVYILVVLFLALFTKNNRFINILLIVTLYILLAFERSEQDYLNYVRAYDSFGSGSYLELFGYEPGFFLFCLIGNNYGLTFDVARAALLCVIEVLAITSTIKVFTPKVAFVIALFIIYPAIYAAELLRWFAGMTIVIFALPYLIRGESKWDYLTYSLLVVLAACMHTSCLFFLVYNIIYLNDKQRILRIVIVSAAVIFLTAQTFLLYKILGYLPISDSLADRQQQYDQTNIFGIIELSIRVFFIFFLGFYVSYKYKKLKISPSTYTDNHYTFNRNKYSRSQMGLLLCDKIWYINIISFLLIGLASYTSIVQRLFQVLLFINTIAAANVMSFSRGKRVRLVTISCVVLTFILHLLSGPQHLDILMSHFKEGFLVNFMDSVIFDKSFQT